MLEDWFIQYVDSRFDEAHEPVTGKGQIYLVGSSARGSPAFFETVAH